MFQRAAALWVAFLFVWIILISPAQAQVPLLPPTNITTAGRWDAVAKKGTDDLSWSPVAGAVSYNVYRYGVLLASVATTSYSVPPASYISGLTYTVTAIDKNGDESIPSDLAHTIGASDPAKTLSTATLYAPGKIFATPQLNAGKLRVFVYWYGHTTDGSYNVYKNGKLVCKGRTTLTYVDDYVTTGDVVTYGATACLPAYYKAAESAPTSVTLTVQPPALPATPGVVTGLAFAPSDDSVVVSFAPVPGAADYRIYKQGTDGANNCKYAGGTGTAIEMNNLMPGVSTALVVEALDKLGPVQLIDPQPGQSMMSFPGVMRKDGTMVNHVNGKGNPTSVPNVIARGMITVTPVASTFGKNGSQVFFDTFRNSQPFAKVPVDPAILAANTNGIYQYDNDKWSVIPYEADIQNTAPIFIMSNHMMDTFFDGGTPKTSIPSHNNNASIAFSPKATADISGGKVLHITFQVDAHFDGRRWCPVYVAEAGDPLINPGKFESNTLPPTTKGRVFVFDTRNDAYQARLPIYDYTTKTLTGNGIAKVPRADPGLNSIDLRHNFDLYLSTNRCRVEENGKRVVDSSFPAGLVLPFTKCQVYFIHQVYHTGNDYPGLKTYQPLEQYWYNYRPWSDERHWDSLGFEVIQSFPP